MQSQAHGGFDVSILVINKQCVFRRESKSIEGPFEVLARRFGVTQMAGTEYVIELRGVACG